MVPNDGYAPEVLVVFASLRSRLFLLFAYRNAPQAARSALNAVKKVEARNRGWRKLQRLFKGGW